MINFVEEDILLDNYFFPIIDNKRKYKSKKWVEPHPKYIVKHKVKLKIRDENTLEKSNIETNSDDSVDESAILDVIDKNEIKTISVPGYKGKFVIQNNIATLKLRGYKRIFTNFTISELEEILTLLKFRFKNSKLTSKISASRFLYYLKVWIETEKNAMYIENIDIRGVNYHIDHIVPISFCYANNICHIKTGGIKNLQILSREDNLIKNKKVSIAEIYRVH